MKKLHMTTIKRKILRNMIATTVVSMLFLGCTGIMINFFSSASSLKVTMQGTAKVVADRVEQELNAYRDIARSAGMLPELSNPNISAEQKKQILNDWATEFGMTTSNLIDLSGAGILDGGLYGDREYFKSALKGTSYISTPLLSRRSNQVLTIVSSPVWMNGQPGGEIAGVVTFAPTPNFLNDIMTSVHISDHSTSYIIDKDGNTIADVDPALVGTQNIQMDAQSDSSLKPLAEYHTKMRAGESGTGQYTLKGVDYFFSYVPINGTDGWSLGLKIPKSDLMGPVYQSTIITIILIVISIIVGTAISIRLALSIGRPIQQCVARISALAMGDLDTPLPDINTNDETGQLVKETSHIVNTLKTLIDDIEYLLTSISNSDFTVESRYPEYYVGNYEALLQSIQTIRHELSDTIHYINISSEQVAVSADQVSDGAQALAQGATEQASAVQELSATINDIARDSLDTAQMALNARTEANLAGSELNSSNECIQVLKKAMDNISNTSHEIEKIISTIEDIAFQTNILALNAAIEAARAGSAGKGFAVVADEVRNLASKSDKAAKATKELIEKSIIAVNDGSHMMDQVTNSVDIVMQSAGKTVQQMDDVAIAIQRTSSSIQQVTQGIDQISSVVQTNSATSEQSAATSEEMSGQAQALKELISRFKLLDPQK